MAGDGEVRVDIDGKTYTLALTIDAMVAVEDLFSTPQRELRFEEIAQRADAGHMKYLRGLLWGVFQTHHPEITLQQISRLIQKGGGIGVFTKTLLDLAAKAAADPRDLKDLGMDAPARPREAQAVAPADGTGEGSTSRPVATA